MRARRILLCLMVLFVTVGTKPVAADGDWLDDDQASWNEAGMAVPAAPSAPVTGDDRCQGIVRPAETREDAQVTAQGWRLYGDYRRGWGLTLVGGFLNFDAMCRPVPYQLFAFLRGVFVGTLAPYPMFPRTDGSLTDARISGDGTVSAVYERYAATDPLCCPSGKAFATFALAQTPVGPVLGLKSAYTNFATATASPPLDRRAMFAVSPSQSGEATCCLPQTNTRTQGWSTVVGWLIGLSRISVEYQRTAYHDVSPTSERSGIEVRESTGGGTRLQPLGR